MKNKILFALFALLFAVQLAVPAFLGVRAERVAQTGQVLKFKCRPCDPRDLFRGHYLQLNLEAVSYGPVPASDFDAEWIGKPLYYKQGLPKGRVRFLADTAGFARIESVVPDTVQASDNALLLTCKPEFDTERKTVKLTPVLPFSRFYVNEADAKALEKALRDATRSTRGDQQSDTYLVVSVANGGYAVMDLVIGGQSVNAMLGRAEKPLAYGSRN